MENDYTSFRIPADWKYFLASLLTESRSDSFVAAMDTKLKRLLRCRNGFQTLHIVLI
jgi:hypothetical protein